MTDQAERVADDVGEGGTSPAARHRIVDWRLCATWLLGLAAVATAGLSLLGHLGGSWWIFDLAAALRPQYATVLALSAGLLFAAGSRRAGLALAVVALIEAAIIAPLWLVSPPPTDPDTSLLRVHFHNVHGGGDERFAEVARDLASSGADVVFLAETHARWIELFADADLAYELIHPQRREDHRGLLVLSRVPVEAVGAEPLTGGSRSDAVAVDLTLDGRPLRLLGLHAHSPRDAGSSALRDAEFDAIGDWVTAQSVPVAIVGDLNATAWSHPFRRLKQHTGLHDSQDGFGFQPTWKEGTGLLMVPLDHLLHERHFTVVDRSTGPSLGSTHRSLQTALAWRGDS